MPCYTDPSPTREEALSASLETTKALLCSTCKALEQQGYDFGLNPELDRWWDRHKKENAARVAKEAKEKLRMDNAIELSMQKPLGAMTADEKKLLRDAGLL